MKILEVVDQYSWRAAEDSVAFKVTEPIMIREQEDTQWFDKNGFWEAFMIKPVFSALF